MAVHRRLPIDRRQAIISIFERTKSQLAAAIYGIPAILYAAPVGFKLVDMASCQIFHNMFLGWGLMGLHGYRDICGRRSANIDCRNSIAEHRVFEIRRTRAKLREMAGLLT